MIPDPTRRRAAEQHARKIAHAIASTARWHLDYAGLALPAPFDGYLYADVAELLVVPTALPLDEACRAAHPGTRHARSEALIISCADTIPVFAIGLWRRRSTHWHIPAQPWMSDRGLLWMFVKGDGQREGIGEGWITFPLTRDRLIPGIVPWATPSERLTGQLRAASWLRSLD